MDLVVHVVMLATAVVGLATAIVKAVRETRDLRPEEKTDRE